MTQGAKWGVLTLLAVIVFVLVAIVTVAVFWARRARMLEAAEAYDQKPPMRDLFEGAGAR
jgi:hypothetical protein